MFAFRFQFEMNLLFLVASFPMRWGHTWIYGSQPLPQASPKAFATEPPSKHREAWRSNGKKHEQTPGVVDS